MESETKAIAYCEGSICRVATASKGIIKNVAEIKLELPCHPLLVRHNSKQYLTMAINKTLSVYSLQDPSPALVYKCTYPKKASGVVSLPGAILYADRYGDVYTVQIDLFAGKPVEEKVPTEEYKFGVEGKTYVSKLIFGHQETIEHIDVSPDQKYICTIDFANKVKITNSNYPTKILTIMFAKSVLTAKFIDNENIITVNKEGGIFIYNIHTSKATAAGKLSITTNPQIYMHGDQVCIVVGQKVNRYLWSHGVCTFIKEETIEHTILEVIKDGIVCKNKDNYELMQ